MSWGTSISIRHAPTYPFSYEKINYLLRNSFYTVRRVTTAGSVGLRTTARGATPSART